MPVDGEIVIDSDIPCAKCGYNLRTLGREGRCPECGEAIWPSIEKFNTSIERWPPLTVETAENLRDRIQGCLAGVAGLALNQINMAILPTRYGRNLQWALIAAIITMILMWMATMSLLPRKKSRWGELLILCATASILLPVAVFCMELFQGIARTALAIITGVAFFMALASVPLSLFLIASWLWRARRRKTASMAFVVLLCHAVTIFGISDELRRIHRSETTLELLLMLPQTIICIQIEAIIPVRLIQRGLEESAWLIPGAVAQWITAWLLLMLAFEFAKARRSIRLSLRDRNTSER